MLMHDVHSTSVDSIGYDPATKEMHVAWKSGKTSVYSDVPEHVATSAVTAWSPGKYLRENVQSNHPHRYL
jgi:hypothetical protein